MILSSATSPHRSRREIFVKIRKKFKVVNTIAIQLYSEKEFIKITGLSRSTIYRSVKKGTFPKAKMISERRKAYLIGDIKN